MANLTTRLERLRLLLDKTASAVDEECYLGSLFEKYNENHDERGRFSSGEGGVLESVAGKVDAEYNKDRIGFTRKLADQVAEELHFDKSRIEVSTEPGTEFELNGRKFRAAGVAYNLDAPNNAGRVTIFPNEIKDPASIQGVVAHEIMHQNFNEVLRAKSAETELVMADPETQPRRGPNYEPLGMKADGSLTPPLDKKYPIYSRFEKHDTYAMLQEELGRAAEGKAVSPYAKEYLDALSNPDSHVNTWHATSESLSEMARIHYETGILPGGKRIRAYYKDVLKTAAEITRTKPWLNSRGQKL